MPHRESGIFGMLALLLRAYRWARHYTGIEAVSNGMSSCATRVRRAAARCY